MTHHPRKRFGQHFLHDPAVIERIVRAIDPQPGDTIIEIGPGQGAITLPLLQKEVVERMAAAPGNKRYGRLTVMLAVSVKVEKLFTIGAGAFKPPPAVESAFCSLTPWPQPAFEVPDAERFRRLVTQAFSARRKTLRNALKGMVSVEQIRGLDIDPGLRPENLSPAQFAALAALR